MAKIKALDNGYRYFAPDLHHAGQQTASLDIEAAVEADGKHNGLRFVGNLQLYNMSLFQGQRELVTENFCQVDAEEGQEFIEARPINNAETKKFVNTRNRIGIFYLCQPGIRDLKILVALILRYPSAELFYFSRRDSEVIP